MIVWNTFQTDARVLKEAETLAGEGHRVTVFALLQPGETPAHEVLGPGLEVVRVSRTPLRALRRLFLPDGSRPLQFRYAERSESSIAAPIREFVTEWLRDVGIATRFR